MTEKRNRTDNGMQYLIYVEVGSSDTPGGPQGVGAAGASGCDSPDENSTCDVMNEATGTIADAELP